MKNQDRIFGLLAVLAVVIYMLACGSRPAWSPDSDRVVFSFVDDDSETSGLAIYDLQTEQVSRIYEAEGEVLFQPIWLGRSEQIIALAAKGDQELQIIEINLPSGQSRLIKSIPAKEGAVALMVPPVLIDDRYLFFSAQLKEEQLPHCLYRFDLETEKLQPVPKGDEHYLFRFGSDYIYIAAHEEGAELGTFDAKSLRFKRLIKLDSQKYGNLTAGLAAKKNGKELAMVVKRSQEQGDKKFEVLILNNRGKILKSIPLPKNVAFTEAVHMTYGPKEISLWLPAVTPVEPNGKEEYIFSLLELDVENSGCSEIFTEHVGDKGAACAMQPNISPDGKYLAVNVLLPKDQHRTVLYLVDLTTPERKVTRVSLPAKPQPDLPAEDEKQ